MNQEKIALSLLGIAVELLGGKVGCCTTPAPAPAPKRPCNCGCAAHTPKPNFDREPDGVQIVVDRPRQEDYRTRQAWAQDMANYRGLIDQAKKCEGIKTRKPDFIPQEVHNGRRDWYDDHGQGFNDIKRTVINAERRSINPFDKTPQFNPVHPQGIKVVARISGFDPDEAWF